MFETIDAAILTYFASINTYYGLLLLLAVFEATRRSAFSMTSKDMKTLEDGELPPIDVIVAAHNETEVVLDTLYQLFRNNYPNLRVVLVNDGSTDSTLETVIREFNASSISYVPFEQLETERVYGVYEAPAHPLVIIDKDQGGKSDALNAGLNQSQAPFVATVDADTLVEKNAFHQLVEPFLYDRDGVVASGGAVYLSNGATVDSNGNIEFDMTSWFASFQVVEYIRGFIFGRLGMNRLGGNLIISGALGLFDRRTVIEVGGYSRETVGEDMELVLRLQKASHGEHRKGRVAQIKEPICFSQGPEDIGSLGRQRSRWQRGLAESLGMHKDMFFNNKYGMTGWITAPAFVLFELIGPVIELFGYGWFVANLMMGRVNWTFTIGFLVIAVGWGTLLSILALQLEYWSNRVIRKTSHRIKLQIAALFDNLGYRQLTLLFRLKGCIQVLMPEKGKRTWGHPKRVARDSKVGN
jgi:cellulose synthase/poly-beta-1,6-N-acetylglucosamine synthase-like glycosyltransferase